MTSSERCQRVLPAAACALLVLPVSSAGATMVEGAHGSATIGEILGRPASFEGEEAVERKTFQYYLPPGAEQGPDTWYTIRLNAKVTFSAGSGSGSVLVSGATNGRAAAQIGFYPRFNKDGEQVVLWESVDAFTGDRSGRVRGRTASVRYENLLQFSGVRPGLNRLSFETESSGSVQVESVRIGSASGVYASPAGPPDLRLNGEFPDSQLEVGETGSLYVKVASSNSRKLEQVEITAQPATDRLFIDGSPVRRIARLEDGRSVRFAVGRTSPGDLSVRVGAVAANGAEASTIVSAEVGVEGGSGLNWQWIAGLGVLAGLGAAFAIRHYRRREDS